MPNKQKNHDSYEPWQSLETGRDPAYGILSLVLSRLPVLRASLLCTVGASSLLWALMSELSSFYGLQMALDLARIGYEWVNTNDFCRSEPSLNAET